MADEKKPASKPKESSSVAETIENAPGIEAGQRTEMVAVQSTTESTPSAADESSAPGPYQGEDAPKPEDPPVRAAMPDTPVAQTLTAGAGEHTPADPDVFDSEGRPRKDDEAA